MQIALARKKNKRTFRNTSEYLIECHKQLNNHLNLQIFREARSAENCNSPLWKLRIHGIFTRQWILIVRRCLLAYCAPGCVRPLCAVSLRLFERSRGFRSRIGSVVITRPFCTCTRRDAYALWTRQSTQVRIPFLSFRCGGLESLLVCRINFVMEIFFRIKVFLWSPNWFCQTNLLFLDPLNLENEFQNNEISVFLKVIFSY